MGWFQDVLGTFGAGTSGGHADSVDTQRVQGELEGQGRWATAARDALTPQYLQQTAEDRKLAIDTAKNLSDSSSSSLKYGQDQQQRFKDKFQPLEDQQISDAQHYADPANMERMRGRAISGVGQAADAARTNAEKSLEGYGISPGSVRYAALDTGVRAAEAAAKAAAGNQSDLQTEATGRGLRQQAIQTGQTDNQQGLQASQIGASTGATAANTALASSANTANILGNLPTWSNLAAQDYKGAGDLAVNTGKVNVDAAKINQGYSTGIGKLAGTVGSFFLAKGGAIPDPSAQGGDAFAGEVPNDASPSGGQTVDDVNARLTSGEFVMPKDVTQWFGHKTFQDMIMKARKAMSSGSEAPAKPDQAIPTPGGAPMSGGQGYAEGGDVHRAIQTVMKRPTEPEKGVDEYWDRQEEDAKRGLVTTTARRRMRDGSLGPMNINPYAIPGYADGGPVRPVEKRYRGKEIPMDEFPPEKEDPYDPSPTPWPVDEFGDDVGGVTRGGPFPRGPHKLKQD